jgi:hypothetical protein
MEIIVGDLGKDMRDRDPELEHIFNTVMELHERIAKIRPNLIVSVQFGDKLRMPGIDLPDASDDPFADAPFSDAPFSDAPFSDAPFSDAPFSDAPFSDAPFSDAPFSDAPFSNAFSDSPFPRGGPSFRDFQNSPDQPFVNSFAKAGDGFININGIDLGSRIDVLPGIDFRQIKRGVATKIQGE